MSAFRDSRISKNTRNILTDMFGEDKVQAAEQVTKTAAEAAPVFRDFKMASYRAPSLERATENVIPGKTEADLVKEARLALIGSYKQAGIKNIQTSLLGVQDFDKWAGITFEVSQGRKRAQVTAYVGEKGVSPIKIAELVLPEAAPEVYKFAYKTDEGVWEEGPYVNGWELKKAFETKKVCLAETQPRTYLLGLLPEDKRDLTAIAKAVLKQGKLYKEEIKKQASTYNPLSENWQEFNHAAADLVLRITEAEDKLKTASDNTRDNLYTTLKEQLTGVQNVARHYVDSFSKIAETFTSSDRAKEVKTAKENLGLWQGLVDDLAKKSTALWLAAPKLDTLSTFKASFAGEKIQTHAGKKFEAQLNGYGAESLTEEGVLRELIGGASALEMLVQNECGNFTLPPANPNFYANASMSKEEAGYRKGSKTENCGNCDMYSDQSCNLVKGAISPDDTCNHWEKKNAKEAQVRDNSYQVNTTGNYRVKTEADEAYLNFREAVKSALSDAKGKTLDQVCVETGLDKGTVHRAVESLIRSGMDLLDVNPKTSKGPVCSPGHDLLNPGLYVIAPKGSYELDNGAVKWVKGKSAQYSNPANFKLGDKVDVTYRNDTHFSGSVTFKDASANILIVKPDDGGNAISVPLNEPNWKVTKTGIAEPVTVGIEQPENFQNPSWVTRRVAGKKAYQVEHCDMCGGEMQVAVDDKGRQSFCPACHTKKNNTTGDSKKAQQNPQAYGQEVQRQNALNERATRPAMTPQFQTNERVAIVDQNGHEGEGVVLQTAGNAVQVRLPNNSEYWYPVEEVKPCKHASRKIAKSEEVKKLYSTSTCPKCDYKFSSMINQCPRCQCRSLPHKSADLAQENISKPVMPGKTRTVTKDSKGNQCVEEVDANSPAAKATPVTGKTASNPNITEEQRQKKLFSKIKALRDRGLPTKTIAQHLDMEESEVDRRCSSPSKKQKKADLVSDEAGKPVTPGKKRVITTDEQGNETVQEVDDDGTAPPTVTNKTSGLFEIGDRIGEGIGDALFSLISKFVPKFANSISNLNPQEQEDLYNTVSQIQNANYPAEDKQRHIIQATNSAILRANLRAKTQSLKTSGFESTTPCPKCKNPQYREGEACPDCGYLEKGKPEYLGEPELDAGMSVGSR